MIEIDKTSAFTLLVDASPDEIDERRKQHLEKFIENLKREDRPEPSEKCLKRWYYQSPSA